MTGDETFIDAKGQPLTLGARVQVGDTSGEVVGFTGPDGDFGEFPIYIPPKVRVRFENGEEDTYSGYSTARWHDEEDAPWRVDEVEVAGG